ncbi:hypothetical protein DV736_g4698, partial [Chaetothyriales sp. CBS 134916]
MGKGPLSPASSAEPPRMDPPPPYGAAHPQSVSRGNEDSERNSEDSSMVQSTQNPSRSSNPRTYNCQRKEEVGGCMNYGSSAGCMNYESRGGCMNYRSTGGCLNYEVGGEYEGNEGCPAVRIHNSTPTPQKSSQDSPQAPSMIAQQSPFAGGLWQNYQGGYLSAVPRVFQSQPLHKRGSSGSSVASAGPPSPLSPSTLYPHIATDNYSPSYTLMDYQTPQTAKSLSSAHDMSGLLHDANSYHALDMRRIQSSGADDRASFTQSTMSHDSPATPHTIYENEYEDQKLYPGYPSTAYQQSLQDVFPDQQFVFPHQPMQRLPPATHRQTMMADRLQAAQNDHLHTNSPTSNPREKSPFRQNSPYNMCAPAQRTPAQLRRQRSSISPKELLLEEHDVDDENQTPLIQQQPQHLYPQHNRSHLSTMYTPNFGNEQSIQIPPQQYPFVSQQSRNENQSSLAAGTPDFPAQLISMESTNEDGPEMISSQPSLHDSQTQPQSTPRPRRPADTSSDSGTYSCTYHGCALRFDTPAKLQKHKREGHRPLSPTSTSASPNLALRNSQAGPHRCDRPNPATGKPCNSVFSRPYDLTRHEDTIHNVLKQKVRCHLCTEDRTFSRSDALTRHMRVVHSDVDWVGKQKRKSHK